MTKVGLATRTRSANSIPAKLLRQGKIHILPIYYLGTLSRLGKESLLNQGSAECFDLIYRNQPEGKYILGKIFDKHILNVPAARATRNRLSEVKRTLKNIIEMNGDENDIRIFSVPCGYATDLIEVMSEVRGDKVSGYGIDLDENAVEIARLRALEQRLEFVTFNRGNAFKTEDYPNESPNIIISIGLVEYLTPKQRDEFYRRMHSLMAPGGHFISSFVGHHPHEKSYVESAADWKMNLLEKDEVEDVFRQLPFTNCKMWYENENIITIIHARK